MEKFLKKLNPRNGIEEERSFGGLRVSASCKEKGRFPVCSQIAAERERWDSRAERSGEGERLPSFVVGSPLAGYQFRRDDQLEREGNGFGKMGATLVWDLGTPGGRVGTIVGVVATNSVQVARIRRGGKNRYPVRFGRGERLNF